MIDILDKTKRWSAKKFIKCTSTFKGNIKRKKVNSLYLREVGKKAPLYELNSTTPYGVGSIVKVMTTLVFLREGGDIDKEVEVGSNPLIYTGDDSIYSNVNLEIDDKFFAKELLKQSMSVSACDSAQAVADIICKKDDFIDLMNRTAEDLKMEGSKFFDPAGSNIKNKMTSEDIYRMTEYLLENHRNELLSVLKKEVWVKGKKYNSTSPKFKHPWGLRITSIKTGYLGPAGRSIILYIEDTVKDKDYVLIVVGAKRLIYRDYFIEELIKEYIEKDFSVRV